MKSFTINTLLALLATCWGASFARSAEPEPKLPWRWDCGTANSPVMPGYQRLTAADQYDEQRGYGWETPRAIDKVFPQPTVDRTLQGSAGQEIMFAYTTSCRTDLTTDGVVSETDLVFRLDVPDGKYRVVLTVGDMSQAIGSMDVKINDQLVMPHLAVWSRGNYRMFIQNPGPWWRTIRATADARKGTLRIVLSKNQSYYDTELARQAQWETPYARWYHATPIIQKPPYVFIGAPFVHNSLMAIEVSPHAPPPLTGDHDADSIELTRTIGSPALNEAVSCYNRGDYSGAIRALDRVREPDAGVAKALLQLWVAGRLETESERTLVPAAVETLRDHVGRHPHDLAVADILTDADIYLRAWDYHATRGQLGKNHFNENNKAINWWLLIGSDSPLYYKAQLHLVRAARMLVPYFPTIASEEAIFRMLEAKCPNNRFVRYHLYQEWENTGDGSGYYDWVMEDYASKANDAPPWVRAIYPAYAGLVDLSQWWIRFRQEPEGTIGGGWGDDVEMVGLFGYYGYISRDASELCLQGASKLVDGVWNLSEVDPERGYCAPIADAEHTAEWTGNTLGMMMQIDYGNPLWIERSMKTGKLIRDLWTGIDDRGRRHFRSNFFGASAVGTGDQANDSFINYRAVSPATSVLAYNGNPTILTLYQELADAWVESALSTDRGKPAGVIPAQVSWPDGILGGTNSPNWWTASHPPGTVNYDWWDEKSNTGQSYKNYLIAVFKAVYQQTRDPKYFEPLRHECELASRHGYAPGKPIVRNPDRSLDPDDRGATAEPGSELWVAARLQNTQAWRDAERMIHGRRGELELVRTREEIVQKGQACAAHLRKAWPISTSEAGPTDRVGFRGIVDPFIVYTGGGFGGPLLYAAFTYENTTKDFAAAVLGADAQGAKILYYSMTPDTRTVGLIPWQLEPGGTYQIRYGVDQDGDDRIDRVEQEREFVFRQLGQSIPVQFEPRKVYVIEIANLLRGRPAGLDPDPAVCADDLDYDAARGMLIARVHNVGSREVRNLTATFYRGDPQLGGEKVGSRTIDRLEAPIDLEPRVRTVMVPHVIEGDPQDIHVVLDAENTIRDEITDFNNVAHALLPRPQVESPTRKKTGGSMRRGR